MKSFINQQRLRNYPLIILSTMIATLALNLLFHEGWYGAAGQIIGGDFLAQYGGGLLYRLHPGLLYDYEAQFDTQQHIVKPTSLWGVNVYTYPPYVALIHSFSTYLPYLPSLIFRTFLTITCTFMASFFIYRFLIPPHIHNSGLTLTQIMVLTVSFMPFVVGLQMGQNHGLTLILITGILSAIRYEKWSLAGILCGFLLYKPQFILGFMVLFLFWGQFKAIAMTAFIALAWNAVVWLQNGIGIFMQYFQVTPQLLQLPYMEGAGGEMQVTPYGLLLSLLPQTSWIIIVNAYKIWLPSLLLLLSFFAYQYRKKPMTERIPVLILAALFGLVASPHSLVHELVILAPVFALCAWISKSKALLYLIICVYFGVLLLIPFSYQLGIALLAVIPLGFFLGILYLILRKSMLIRSLDHHEQEVAQ
jgi:hypothetical protein